jgi:SAM-dependent methyltransferase
MRRDVLELRAFYATSLGRAARDDLGRKVSEAWGDVRGLDVLGLGYATPFVDPLRAAGPPGGGGHAGRSRASRSGPAAARNLACLVDETPCPSPTPCSTASWPSTPWRRADAPGAMLREIWRVLAPSGRLIVAVAARRRPVGGTPRARRSATAGRYSRRQLEALLREAELEPAAGRGPSMPRRSA